MSDRFDLSSSPGYLVNRAGRAMAHSLGEQLQPLGLTTSQWAVIHQVHQTPGLTQRELAERVGMDAPTLTGILGRLGTAVERRDDPTDRRTLRVYGGGLDPRTIDAAASAAESVNERALAGVNARDRRIFESVLRRIITNCEES